MDSDPSEARAMRSMRRRIDYGAPPSRTWRLIEDRAAATTMMFRKSDSIFWLLTLAAIGGLVLAFYLS
jgi:hypothetical protein